LKTLRSALYNLGRNLLRDAAANPLPAPQPDLPGRPRRWSIIAAGLLLFALALVVIYTSRAAFFSPLALVVVAAIGLAALLLELRFRKDVSPRVRAPLWLNVLGLVFAVGAVFADLFHFSANLMLVAALGSVICFAISGMAILHALRKKKV
jgi:drug/metabolite transporter (DMT)-like permease